jgi:hypothetical protein
VVDPILSKLPPSPAGKTPDTKAIAPLASGNPPGKSAPLVAPFPASASVPLFGGFRGGRKRLDGFRPGSPEAIQADRDKEAKRKRDKRSALAAAAPPPPLPSAIPSASAPASDKTFPPGPGLAAVPPAEIVPVALAWQDRDLLSVTTPAVSIVEAALLRGKKRKLKLAKLPADIIGEVERDLAWPSESKKMLAETSSALSAKYLNKAGLSAEYKLEVNFSLAVLNLVAHEQAVNRRLDKLIAAAAVTDQVPPKEKKP